MDFVSLLMEFTVTWIDIVVKTLQAKLNIIVLQFSSRGFALAIASKQTKCLFELSTIKINAYVYFLTKKHCLKEARPP